MLPTSSGKLRQRKCIKKQGHYFLSVGPSTAQQSRRRKTYASRMPGELQLLSRDDFVTEKLPPLSKCLRCLGPEPTEQVSGLCNFPTTWHTTGLASKGLTVQYCNHLLYKGAKIRAARPISSCSARFHGEKKRVMDSSG